MKEEDELTEHKRQMLRFMQAKKKKLQKKIKLPPPPSSSDDLEEKPKQKEPRTIDEMGKWELDKEIIRRRIKQLDTRTLAFQMDIARVRDALIERALVEKQLAYFVIAIRQKVLAIPNGYARQLLHKEDIKEVHSILKKMAFQMLLELKDLPNKVTNDNWLEELAEEEEQ
ncbi:MAG TPA: hypothetical protein VNZ45_01725 [Bacteroidia bacterium]|jgi:hypothetical protein|nr:hypothetical protein [Bacteroidia bacterium]